MVSPTSAIRAIASCTVAITSPSSADHLRLVLAALRDQVTTPAEVLVCDDQTIPSVGDVVGSIVTGARIVPVPVAASLAARVNIVVAVSSQDRIAIVPSSYLPFSTWITALMAAPWTPSTAMLICRTKGTLSSRTVDRWAAKHCVIDLGDQPVRNPHLVPDGAFMVSRASWRNYTPQSESDYGYVQGVANHFVGQGYVLWSVPEAMVVDASIYGLQSVFRHFWNLRRRPRPVTSLPDWRDASGGTVGALWRDLEVGSYDFCYLAVIGLIVADAVVNGGRTSGTWRDRVVGVLVDCSLTRIVARLIWWLHSAPCPWGCGNTLWARGNSLLPKRDGLSLRWMGWSNPDGGPMSDCALCADWLLASDNVPKSVAQ